MPTEQKHAEELRAMLQGTRSGTADKIVAGCQSMRCRKQGHAGEAAVGLETMADSVKKTLTSIRTFDEDDPQKIRKGASRFWIGEKG